MKNLKRVIIILTIIIFFILIITIYFINKGQKMRDEEGNMEEPEYIEGSYTADNIIKKLDNRDEYFIIKSILQKIETYIDYLDYDLSQTRIQFENTEEEEQFLDEYKQQGIDIIKSIMPKEYIQKFNVNDETIYQELIDYANKNIVIDDIYVCENSENIKTYFLYSNLKELNKELPLEIVVDCSNNSFNVMLEDYITDMNISRENIVGTNIEQNIKSIDTNEYNIYDIPNNSDQMYIQELFQEYKGYLENDYERAYNMLYNDYKQKRFNNLESFKNYIDNNLSHILEMELSKYKINNYDDYTEYICINEYGDYFIFRETAVMDYTVILDTYTIDLPEVIQKYNNGNEQVKVGMNIEKIIAALNSKDYNFVYDKLDESFKNSKFNSIEKFEEYMKRELYETNQVEYIKFSKEGSTFIYELNIEEFNNNTNSKNVTVIMKLLEGTNFIMSFSIN